MAAKAPSHRQFAGPVLQAAAGGELKVALRSYPRPTRSTDALVNEPDLLDQHLADYLAGALHSRLVLVPPAQAQLVINLPHAGSAARGPAAPQGAMLALRGEARDELAGAEVCVGEGSPWQAALQKEGARLKAYPSSLRASVAFMGGECRFYADSRAALEGLLQLPEWRFYRLLPQRLDASSDARVYLAGDDSASRDWVRDRLAQWRRDGGQAKAWAGHADELLSDSLKLADGLVCH
ncbi:ABC transporter substrate-binding protein [Pseudomonas sp. KNUC1026]|uniref:ABC transporter substrate-binding protein n=1 Tax=Pseudomonas sp. KNUC1026 TaxID=2893890 RepID=UPI001F35A980|nr:ABC transporter substrate-binding protein [Pseudomonas sp. KNUC1026]UFH50261.1 ABC transporter substrate-binding protein [Pseudomonas sp. KNUC1026]